MPAVPWSANLISDCPFLLAISDSDYSANDFVAGSAGKYIAKGALLREGI
jgi:hypothetical protein